jgi:DNA-binding NarL/FixJ family response regulator
MEAFSGSRVLASWIAWKSETLLPTLSLSSDAAPADDTRATTKKRLRVLIADDHEAVRRGLKSAVAGAGWDVCGEATNGKEAIEQARELRPDVVILDISMPVMGGLEAAPQILKSAPKAKVVAFTMHESPQIKNEVLRIGVHGLAVKSAPLSNLLQTIRFIVGA